MTYQYSDLLLFEKKKIFLNDQLLEDYFKDFPKRKPHIEVHETALWRGYVATFEVRDSELFIKDIEVLSATDTLFKSVLNDVFPDEKKFSWYTGLIRIDDFRGRFDTEPKNGIFEFLEIQNGNVLRKRTMDYAELQVFKRDQFEYFMMSDYVESVYSDYRNSNKEITNEAMNRIIFDRILYLTKEVYVS